MCISIAEAISAATAFMEVAHYVIRDLENAYDKCTHPQSKCTGEDCGVQPDLHLMEGAVGFYAGSLEGQDGNGDGVLMYDTADDLCQEFKTCGDKGDKVSGTSKVNIEIFKEFNAMQKAFQQHDCGSVRRSIDRVSQLMWVPLIQGTIRQAYISSRRAGASRKEEAIGAAFAASIMGLIYKCHPTDAAIVYDNMKPNRGKTDFAAVKDSLERNYACLRLTCEDVGGYYYGGLFGHYYDGADPCFQQIKTPLTTAQIVGITLGVFFGSILACCCYCIFRPRRRYRTNEVVSVTRSAGEVA